MEIGYIFTSVTKYIIQFRKLYPIQITMLFSITNGICKYEKKYSIFKKLQRVHKCSKLVSIIGQICGFTF